MRAILLIILLALLLQPPDPHLTARYLPSGAIVVSWTQQSRGCLATGAALIGCYDGPGRVRVTIGRVGPVDGAVRGGEYRAEIDGVRYRAEVRGVVYLGVIRA
jgi:hypothetical protein